MSFHNIISFNVSGGTSSHFRHEEDNLLVIHIFDVSTNIGKIQVSFHHKLHLLWLRMDCVFVFCTSYIQDVSYEKQYLSL